jgi:hypothetical protein
MMASRPFKSLFRGAGRNALDLPVAGLSALAAAFATFVIPQDLLSRAVVATGLPSILSAARPPLGLTARVALAVGAAALVFGLVFLLLRLLDRSGLGETETPEERQSGPRVRRRDGHPDAPAPRPISAARDFGEPAPPHAPRIATPLWLDEAEPTPPAFGQASDSEPEPDFIAEPAPEMASQSAPEPAIIPDPVPEPEFWPEPEPWPTLEVQAESEPAPLPEPEPEAAPEPASVPRADMPNSIADLMERLEQGLARRRLIDVAPAVPPQVFPEAPHALEAPAVPALAEAPDDRLQSAIASLQRLAARSA